MELMFPVWTACPLGYLVGYISHRKPRVESSCEQKINKQTDKMIVAKASPTTWLALPSDVQLTWQEVTRLLTDKLSSQAFEKALGYVHYVHIFFYTT